MGHSDRLVIADGNFPSESMGKDAIGESAVYANVMLQKGVVTE